jgi:chemotaxis protein MotB
VLDDAPPKKEVNGGAWLLTYGDMVTLLMAFFVMLFAVSSIETIKFEAFLSGLSDFDNPAASQMLSPVGDPIPPPVQPPVQAVMPGATGTRDLAGKMAAAMANAGIEGEVDLQVDKRGLVLIVGTDDVLFESGSAVISERGRTIVGALAPELTGIPNDLVIEGHTDDVPLDRNGYTNWNLSTDRAVAVVNALARDHRVDPRRLEATGYGEWSPRDTGSNAAARARNRRVEIVILAATEAEADVVRGTLDGPTGIGGPPDIGPGIQDPAGVRHIVPPIAPR